MLYRKVRQELWLLFCWPIYLIILIISQGQDGATPLRCAVQEGQAGVVAVLLANGGNVEELVSNFSIFSVFNN